MNQDEDTGLIINLDVICEKRKNLIANRRVEPRLRFGRADANLIIRSYRLEHNPNRRPYLCHKRHIRRVLCPGPRNILRPILISKPVIIRARDTPLAGFIENYFPDDLKEVFLNKSTYDLMVLFTNSLLNHQCHFEVVCIEYLRLLMKLSIALRTTTCLDWIIRDLRHFDRIYLGSNLMAIYFIKFILQIDLLSFFMQQWDINATKFLRKTADHIIPYFIYAFDPCTHHCVARKNEYLFILLIKHGAENLANSQAYEVYTNLNFFDPYNFQRRVRVRYEPDLLIDSKIKMRVLQVFIWSALYGHNIDDMFPFESLWLSHLDPYITRKEYEDTFDGFVSRSLNDAIKKYLKRVSWESYQKYFKIEDNTPVTPRSLQDVCRFVIRHNLSRKGKLLHGMKELCDDDENPLGGNPMLKCPKYRYLTLEELVDESVESSDESVESSDESVESSDESIEVCHLS